MFQPGEPGVLPRADPLPPEPDFQKLSIATLVRKLNLDYIARAVASFLSQVMTAGLLVGGRSLASLTKIPVSPIRQRRKGSAELLKSALPREEVLIQQSC